jgi:hypothetical protein
MSQLSMPLTAGPGIPIEEFKEPEKREDQKDESEHQRFRHPLTPEGQLLRHSIELGLDRRPKTILIPSKQFGTLSSEAKRTAGTVESVDILGSTIVLDRDRESLSLVESEGRGDTKSNPTQGRLQWVHIHSNPMDFTFFKVFYAI